MKRLLSLLVLVSLTPSFAAEPTVDDVVARYLAARGGLTGRRGGAFAGASAYAMLYARRRPTYRAWDSSTFS